MILYIIIIKKQKGLIYIKVKRFFSIFLGLFIIVSITALPAYSAERVASSNTRTNPKSPVDIIRLLAEMDINYLKYYSQFPDPAAQLEKEYEDGSFVNVDPRVPEIVGHYGVVMKDAYLAVNPKNKEFGKVGYLPVSMDTEKSHFKIKNIEAVSLAYPLQNQLDPDFVRGNFIVTPLYLLRDGNNNLHIICDITNVTGQTRQFYGFQEVEVKADNTIIARGNPKQMVSPITLSSKSLNQKTYGTNGIIDGYPTGCFVDIIFAPDEYNNNINISELGNISIGCISNTVPVE